MSSQPVDRLVAVAGQVLDLQPHRRKPGSLRDGALAAGVEDHVGLPTSDLDRLGQGRCHGGV